MRYIARNTRSAFSILMLILLTSCGEPVEEDFLIGRWAHTRQVETVDPITDRPVASTRSDAIRFLEDRRYERDFHSTIPGEEQDFHHEGPWTIRGRTLKLTFTKEDSTLGRVKGRIEVIDEYSIRLDGRFYSKSSRPRTRRPEERS
jgi:hypothetical protein